MVACMSNVLTASRKGGAGHQTQTKEETLPGDVGPHAPSVLRLFPPVSRKGGAGHQNQTKEETTW